METSGVIRLSERSVEKHNLFYNAFIQDGDSSLIESFAKLMFMIQ